MISLQETLDKMSAVDKNAKRSFSHVIFDMDGLLLDTERIYTEIMQRVISKYGQDFTWELKLKMMGRPGLAAAQIAVDEMQLPITAERFIEEATVHKDELFPECNLMPGAEKLVRHLEKHKIPFALASGSFTKDFVTKTQKHRDLFSLFEIVILGDNPGVKQGKPHPDVFLFAALQFKDTPSPEKVLVFEDAPNGVKAGKTANMGVVMVPDARVDSSLYHNADLILHSLEEFKPEEWGFPAYNDI